MCVFQSLLSQISHLYYLSPPLSLSPLSPILKLVKFSCFFVTRQKKDEIRFNTLFQTLTLRKKINNCARVFFSAGGFLAAIDSLRRTSRGNAAVIAVAGVWCCGVSVCICEWLLVLCFLFIFSFLFQTVSLFPKVWNRRYYGGGVTVVEGMYRCVRFLAFCTFISRIFSFFLRNVWNFPRLNDDYPQ